MINPTSEHRERGMGTFEKAIFDHKSIKITSTIQLPNEQHMFLDEIEKFSCCACYKLSCVVERISIHMDAPPRSLSLRRAARFVSEFLTNVAAAARIRSVFLFEHCAAVVPGDVWVTTLNLSAVAAQRHERYWARTWLYAAFQQPIGRYTHTHTHTSWHT